MPSGGVEAKKTRMSMPCCPAGSARILGLRTSPRPERRSNMGQPDENKLNAFIGKMLGDLGGAFSVPTVRVGLRLGLFDELQKGGPATSDELAKRAGGLTERYIREWALAQAANGFVDYNATSRKFSLSPEQAMV